MKKLTLAAATAALMLATTALSVEAQTQQQGAAGFHRLVQNATPITKANCHGGWGRWCGPGHHRVCGPNRCWCAVC
jgi:hypothetical protein